MLWKFRVVKLVHLNYYSMTIRKNPPGHTNVNGVEIKWVPEDENNGKIAIQKQISSSIGIRNIILTANLQEQSKENARYILEKIERGEIRL